MRGQLIKRAKGSWSIVLSYKDPATGKWMKKWHTYQGKKPDAEKYLNELVGQMQNGTYVPLTKYTVATWLEYWLEEIFKPNGSAATYKSYSDTVHNHIVPEFGMLALQSLSAEHLQKYYNRKLKTLSSTSVLYHHRVLHTALEHARRFKKIQHNPCDDITPPQKAVFEAELPDAQMVESVLEEINGTVMYMPVVLALTTGMRRGEVCGLTWSNVYTDEGYIHIGQAMKRDHDNYLVIDTTKTKRARDIPLTEECRATLKAQRAAQAQAKLFYGQAYQNNDLVCCWEDGRKLDPDYVTKSWSKIKRKLKIEKKTRYHDLRHNFATALLTMGKNMKVVSDLLGHADIRTTYNFYAHVEMEAKKEAIQGLDEKLFKKGKKISGFASR